MTTRCRPNCCWSERRWGEPEEVGLFAVDRPEDPDRQPGAGERVPPDDGVGHAQLTAHVADLVLLLRFTFAGRVPVF